MPNTLADADKRVQELIKPSKSEDKTKDIE